MFDAHNHFTNINSILCTSELLPQNIEMNYSRDKIISSEIGLDKRYTGNLPLDKQLQVFKDLLIYAKKNNIAVSLHCVHFTDLMIKTLSEVKLENGMAIWHGFNGSIETAKELVKLGILISIGPRYNKDLKELYKICPNLLLETDYEGNSIEEHNGIIYNQYKLLSKVANINVENIEENCINAAKAFKDRVDFR